MRRRDEVAVGMLLTVAVAVLILGTLWLARGGLSTGYPLYTRFTWGQNLKQGQPVLLAGVTVGYVGDVRLRQDGYLDVLMRVNDEYKIPRGSTAAVKAVGFFGDVAVAMTPLGPNPKSFNPGDTVPAGPPEASVNALMERVDSIGHTVALITTALQAELVQAGGLSDLRRTIGATAALSAQLSGMAAEQNRNLTMTLAAYRRAAGSIDSVAIDSTLRNFRTTSANMARLTAHLDSSSGKLTSLLARVDRGEGTAGKLVTDTLLYRDVRNLLGSMDSLMTDFKKNPHKYINLRIF